MIVATHELQRKRHNPGQGLVPCCGGYGCAVSSGAHDKRQSGTRTRPVGVRRYDLPVSDAVTSSPVRTGGRFGARLFSQIHSADHSPCRVTDLPPVVHVERLSSAVHDQHRDRKTNGRVPNSRTELPKFSGALPNVA